MKKRSQTTSAKTITTKQGGSSKSQHQKKRNTKSCNEKSKSHQKKRVEEYMILEGNVLPADTKTQRYELDKFINRIRSEAKVFKPQSTNAIPRLNGQNRKQVSEPTQQIVSMEDYVNGLTKSQKMKLLEQLEKQMVSNSQIFTDAEEVQQIIDTKPEENEQDNNDRMGLLNEKLESVKRQLEVKKDQKVAEINKLMNEGEITDVEYRQKVKGVEKIMERNMKIIHCTRNLFETILNSSYEHEFLKNKEIDAAMRELDSFTQIDSPLKSPDHARVDSESSIQSQAEFEKLQLNLEKEEEELGSEKKSVDEPLLISPDKPDTDLDLQKFQCAEESLTKKLKIPLLMTKEKIEEMQQEKKAKAAQKMKGEIEKKIAFQMSELECEEFGNHFTTLADINGYIVGLYEYIIRSDMDKIVERLNFPYGKSVRDKLYLLQQNGEIDEAEYYPVLDDSFYHNYNKEMTLAVRRIPEEEKGHSKAVFDCFNVYLNAYRPYYELEGEVYPWSISEKGITFYEINEENIEQVFEKTKIKVLEFASTLCGIIPHGMEISESPQLVKEKNEELSLKEERLSIQEQFNKWEIKVINYNVMVRFLLSEQILFGEILEAIAQFQRL